MSMNGRTPEPAPQTGEEYAHYLGEFYMALLREGFDRKQAFEIVLVAMRNAAAAAEVGTP